jgi:NitT/TauT family transport system permease protein
MAPASLRKSKALRRILGLLALLVVAQNVSHATKSPMLPDVPAVAVALWDLVLSGVLAQHSQASLLTLAVGILGAVVVGVTLGVAMATLQTLDTVIMPVVDVLRPIAALALFPLLILLFGLGLTPKAAVIFWTAWPPILLSTVQGLRTVDPAVVEAAQIDGAGRWRVLRSITFPLALPAILTGIRIGVSAGWVGLVSAEMLGASAGLGYAVLLYSQAFQFGAMYASIVAIAVLGLLVNQSVLLLQTVVERDLV